MYKTCQLLKILLICIASFLAFPEAFPQHSVSDSCVKLVYHSALERDGFVLICSEQKADYLKMAIAVNPGSGATDFQSINTTIKQEFLTLQSKLSGIKKPAARLKFVFDHVQSNFLKQYDLDADFSDMFKSGKHNCLTATILYRLLLDSLSIKNSIKFMPGHVYLIAYANEVPYIFETTDPEGGFIELSKAVQDEALQGLRVAQYMMSDAKENEKSESFLKSYFIRLNQMELRGLIGYQYVNLTLQKLNKQEFLDSYYYCEKAKVLTPCDELNNLSFELLGKAIDQSDRTSTLRARLLVNFYDGLKTPNKKNIIAEDYKATLYTCLLGSFPAPDSIPLIHSIMMQGMKDADVKAVFEEDYQTSYMYYLSEKVSPEVRFTTLYKKYVEGGKNKDIKNMLFQEINTLTEKYVGNPDISAFDSLTKLYPALTDFDNFIYNRCQSLLKEASLAFETKNVVEGERLLKKFDDEGYFDKNKMSYCNPAYVYSQAGSYYFKKGNTVKAKAALKKGLTYDPDNWELHKKLKELN